MSPFLLPSTNFDEKLLYVHKVLALIPLGGSDVTFYPFYNRVIGKVSVGIDVNQSLNSEDSTFSSSFSIYYRYPGAI